MATEESIVSPKKLRRTYSITDLKPTALSNNEPQEDIIGQDRAVTALRFGLGIRNNGFNIFVAGPSRLGKMTAVKQFLEKIAIERETPPDWCYVNNFDDSSQPIALRLPSGRGRQLQQDMERFIERLQAEVPKAFEGESYLAKRERIQKELDQQRTQINDEVNQYAKHAGYLLQMTQTGVMMIPVRNDQPLSDKEFAELPEAERSEYIARRNEVDQELKKAMKRFREKERIAEKKIEEADKSVLLYIVGGFIEDLMDAYDDLPSVIDHLKRIQKDLVENREALKTKRSGTLNQLVTSAPWFQENQLRKYEVNVLVDNGGRKGVPIVVELNPAYNNLFGRLEKETQFGALHTDFTLIRPGSFHIANGGYLVLQVDDLLRNPFSWDSVKRTLRSGYIEMEDPVERLGYVSTRILRPQAIPIDMKVILIGSPQFHHLLNVYDEDFQELFKVKADFDTRMSSTPKNVQSYVAFLNRLCKKEELKPLDDAAIVKVLEHSSRVAEDQEKLSTHIGILSDIIREAHFYAGEDKSEFVQDQHVQKAIEEKIYRSSLVQERIRELMRTGTILIDVDGSKVGQVNGLSVISLGDYTFGRPNRITASVGSGPEAIVDIEREVKLGGPFHSKGVLIISGYLAAKFAQDKPLALTARLVFEQSYEGVEGDSASSAELYALLSAISEIPIRQGIAVTGSVNQHGQVQAIGSVNQKIEGFFDLCLIKGLSGKQGVIIPRSNIRNLMLREDVVGAVKRGMFHVWGVNTIEEGIEILTEVPAGERDRNGRYPERTVYDRVERRLRGFIEFLKQQMPPPTVTNPKPDQQSSQPINKSAIK